MTYDHHTFWYFATTQCPDPTPHHLSIISWFRNYLSLYTAGSQVYSQRQPCRKQDSTVLCSQLIPLIHMLWASPSQKATVLLEAESDPAIPSLNPSAQPRFSGYWPPCYGVILPFPKETRQLEASSHADDILGLLCWANRILRSKRGKCLWKICFKWLRTPNSHNENHKVNPVLSMRWVCVTST